jgi:exodeoxyribonuclease III
MSQTLKIASWNINSVRARLDIVTRFLTEEAPDILCLQETKVMNDAFPGGMFRQMGYNHQVLHGQPMHHGVAIISKIPIREDDRLDWQANGEARHVGVRMDNGVRLENVYVPAGGEVPDHAVNPKFAQKLAFVERMIEWSSKLDKPTILTGDFNIAPLECDVWSHKQLIDVVSHTEVECELLARLQASHNWVDIGRHFHPAPNRLYTWWSYRARDWAASDRGRRLDHMWVSPELVEKAVSHRVAEPVRSWARPSDHAPLITEFRF